MSARSRVASVSAGLLAALAVTVPSTPAQADDGTVTIRGYVFQFSKSMFRGVLPGSIVDAEVNGSAADPTVVTPVEADEDGYYEIEVPDNAEISLFATVPESARPLYDLDGSGPLPSLPVPFHTTYNQTFHTSGDDLDFVTFQVPAEPVVRELAGAFGLTVRGDLWPYESLDGGTGQLDFNDGYGALTNGTDDVCVVASTAYRADKRIIVDRSGDRDAPTNAEYFSIFYSNPPHGRDGATATSIPGAGIAGALNPIYFDRTVTPNPTETVTSNDGGVLWVDVPEGTHTVTAHKEGTRFASADITCKPGRFVNASPQWGLYELMPGEQTHPATVTGVTLNAPATAAYGSTITADVTVGGGNSAHGLVEIEVDGSPVATGRVTDGVASVKLPARFAVGEHQVVAHYAPTGTIPTRSSTPVALTTTKAASRTAITVGAKRVKKGKRIKATATVRATGFTPTGRVQFYVGKAKAGKPVKVTAAGKAVRKIRIPGARKVRAVYLGDGTTQRSTSKKIQIRVKKK